MKKRLVSLFIATAMLVVSATSAFAGISIPKADGAKAIASVPKDAPAAEGEVGTTPENAAAINWADVKDTVKATEKLKGKFVTCEQFPVKFYVPDSFEAIDLEQEDIDEGFYMMYMYFDDVVEEAFSIALFYYDFGMESLEEYVDFLKGSFDVETVEYDVINGYQAISYNYPDDEKTGYVSLITDDGGILEFMMDPVNEDEYLQYVAAIVFSIMGADDPE